MPPSQETKKAKREAARQARIEAQRARERAKKRKRMALVAALAVVAVVAGVLFFQQAQKGKAAVAAARKRAGCTPVRTFPELARDHIAPNAPRPKYNSNPPTSGPHRAQPANWGSYDQTVDDVILVHNLEHGGIVVHYKGLPSRQADRLSAIADDYDNGVITEPDSKSPAPLALTAWRKLMTCQKFSEVVVRDFVSEYCNKGPEKVGTTCR